MLKNILNKLGLNNSHTYKQSADNFFSITCTHFSNKLKFVNNRKIRKGK